MAIKDFFHPIFRKALEAEEDVHGLHDTIVDTLQAPLDQAKKDEINAKVDMYLDTSRGEYLDRFGSWFGLSRKKGWTDDYYRDRMKKHVLHERNTINSIRMALANFLETEIKNIYIYEPYRDMFIWNKSFWNTRAFYTSPYYRYAVIDINIDAPIKPGIVDIINLFRPAGVIWVLTNNINGINLDAPIIDLVSPKQVYLLEEDIDYVGFNTRKALEINSGLDSTNAPIDNPFIYNDDESLLNGGKVYYDIVHQNQNFAYLGQLFWNFSPMDTDTFSDSRAYAEQYVTNQYTSNIRGEGQTFSLNPEQNNILKSGPAGTIKGESKHNLQNLALDEFEQVGGRNLLLDTTNQRNTDYWQTTNSNTDTTKYYNGSNVVTKSKEWSNIRYRLSNLVERGVVNTTDYFTFSMLVKGDDDFEAASNTAIRFYCSVSDTNPDVVKDVATFISKTEWKQISATFKFKSLETTSDNGYNESIRFELLKNLVKGNILFTQPTLVRGNKATDWTLAPEDLHGVPSGNYQIGIRLQSNTSQNDTVKITFNGTNPVTETITTSARKDYHYFTRQISLPDKFKSDGTVTLTAGDSSFKYFSIKKATPAPMYYSLRKEDKRAITGLASAIDVQRFLMAYDNDDLTSDFSRLDSIFDYFSINTSLYSNVTNEVTLWAFNFQLGLWINYGTEAIKRGWNYLTTSLGAISPFMNNEGIVFYKLTFKKQNTIRVNYFGLDFGYASEELCSAVADSGLGVVVHSEGYRPRVDPTADGAHLYLDYLTQNIEE